MINIMRKLVKQCYIGDNDQYSEQSTITQLKIENKTLRDENTRLTDKYNLIKQKINDLKI